jgi:hypothetical protein
MYRANSLAEILGSVLVVMGGLDMDEILGSVGLPSGRTLHIGPLARATLEDCGAAHLGSEGYFLFEIEDGQPGAMLVLGKVASLEAAFRMLDSWSLGGGAEQVLHTAP